MAEPSVFIGSSTEGLEFARAIRTNLKGDAEVTLWNEGFFTIGSTFIETLVNSLPRFDFAVLVLSPDDLINSRKDEKLGPRDNIIFELGLFMGRLGRSRTFVVNQANANIKIPTDLSGVTMAQYVWPRQDNNYVTAVGLASDAIRTAIRDLGVTEERAARKLQEVAREQKRQAGDIGWITSVLVDLIVSNYERMHLAAFVSDDPFLADVYHGSSFEAELKHLLVSNLIDRHPGKGIRTLFSEEGKRDVKEHFFITERGRNYLRAYEAAHAAEQEATLAI